MSGRRLSAVIREYEIFMRQNPDVEWGGRDCIHFGLECAAAAGRRDLRGLLPQYSTPREAMRAMRAAGFMSLIEALDAHAKPIPSARALPGDVAFFNQSPLGIVGVVVGAEALFLGAGGFERKALAEVFCWRP